ncbi:MAG: phospho-N-acetylmuramoyl-pentapeptide-transferase [Candidatus Eremiobacteraeota bacterium]|nr:phospho-N-acetylmuramoyl-pentapeptide-transferase [Candidatus Eremiobacteraeota bacterium]
MARIWRASVLGLRMTALMGAFFAGCTLALGLGAPLIRLLQEHQFRQRAYEDAPASHQRKTGTPTMGGLLFLIVALIMMPLVRDAVARDLLWLTLGCGLLGFFDDYLAVMHGKNMGLRARTKFLATALLGIMFLRALDQGYNFYPHDMVLNLPFKGVLVPHWAWFLLSVLVIVSTTHAVNLTDGLDGLAAGAILPPFLVIIIVAVGLSMSSTAVVVGAIAGACCGFLFYNRHPARLFMGDTGALALGGLLAASAIVTGEHLLLLLIGAIFAAETLSVIVQVASFKLTGRRIFRMSPLHHHFELQGWPETKVTQRFWLSSAFFSALGLVLVR